METNENNKHKTKAWGEKRKKLLIKYYNKMSNKELAEKFDTTVRSIESIAIRLELRKDRDVVNKIISKAHAEKNRKREHPDKIYQGYKVVYNPKECTQKYLYGYVYEHVLVMEKEMGRKLKRSEKIIHLDGNKLNNRLDNLELFDKDRGVIPEQLAIDKMNGMSISEIVKKYNISVQYYYDMVKAIGFNVRKCKSAKVTEEEIWKCYKKHSDVNEFCKKHDISSETYKRRLKSLKLREAYDKKQQKSVISEEL